MVRWLVAFCALAASVHAHGTRTVDYSDLWFNPDEPGWGVNLVQQEDTLFATLFVYGADGQPTWYVASSVARQDASGSTFSGTLFRTAGPYFGGPLVGSVHAIPVGSLTFTAASDSAGRLAYTVDGVQVSKSIVRQTWDTQNIAGGYLGTTAGTWSGCGARNGYREDLTTVIIEQNGGSIHVAEDGNGRVCNHVGQYSQAGRLGMIASSGACSDGGTRTFAASQVQATPSGISMIARFSQPDGCEFSGLLTGVRKGTTAVVAPTVDYTDLWSDPAQSGWGVNVVQQNDVLFVTLFVHGADTEPAWYVASSARRQGAVFSGPLYRARAPLSSTRDMDVSPVGTLTFAPTNDVEMAYLSYVVDGVTATRAVRRQTWRRADVTGRYIGATSGEWSNCPSGFVGRLQRPFIGIDYRETPATFTLSKVNGELRMVEQGDGYSCTYTGGYAQDGRFGTFNGSGTCTRGRAQEFIARQVHATPSGITMALEIRTDFGCRFKGRLAGVRGN